MRVKREYQITDTGTLKKLLEMKPSDLPQFCDNNLLPTILETPTRCKVTSELRLQYLTLLSLRFQLARKYLTGVFPQGHLLHHLQGLLQLEGLGIYVRPIHTFYHDLGFCGEFSVISW